MSGSMADREHRTVFVTVGTTCFDALVMAVASPEVKKALLQKGYSNLVIQMGRGTYVPSKVSMLISLVSYQTFNSCLVEL
jgi:beta-1,4-N-acetylglucosaminyltransferase